MDGLLIVTVTACHGAPVDVAGVPTLSKTYVDFVFLKHQVVNDPYLPAKVGEDIDHLLEGFMAHHGCKVNYFDDDNSERREFEVFEPSWPDKRTARQVAWALLNVLIDHVQGLPTSQKTAHGAVQE